MCIELPNHILNYLNRNMIEEFNGNAHYIFLVDHQFVCNGMYRKHMKSLYGKVFN